MYIFKKISKGFIRQRPFCTGPSIGNQVDGLPIDLSTVAVVKRSSLVPRRSVTFATLNKFVEPYTCSLLDILMRTQISTLKFHFVQLSSHLHFKKAIRCWAEKYRNMIFYGLFFRDFTKIGFSTQILSRVTQVVPEVS